MTADDRLALIRVKIERAKQHIHNLNIEVQSFLKSEPYIVRAKRDPQTRKLIYYVASVRDVPVGIAAIVGDVIQNLRSALDHLAYHLVVVGTGGKGPFDHTYFPIADNAAKYKTGAPGKVTGMRKDAIDAIDALKPYKGGNDLLWILHKLNNIDKHRLVLTVGSHFRSVNLAPHIERTFNSMLGKSIPIPDFFIRPADRLFPLKAGDELFIDAPDAEMNEKMQFRFDVAFGEPQVIDGDPLIETLQQMLDLVDGIISGFAPLLA